MTLIVSAFGTFVALLGGVGVVAPGRLIAFVQRWQSRTGLYVIGLLRVGLGVAVFLAAPDSRAPLALRALGVAAITVGVATPMFGVERFRSVLAWWAARGAFFVRAWAVVAVVIGLLLVYAVNP